MLCICYVKGCVEIECPCSINYTKSCYSNLEHLQLCDGKTLLKKSEKLHKITHRGCYWNYKIIFLFELTTAWLLMRYILIINSGVQWKINFKNIMATFLRSVLKWVKLCIYLGTLILCYQIKGSISMIFKKIIMIVWLLSAHK